MGNMNSSADFQAIFELGFLQDVHDLLYASIKTCILDHSSRY